MLAVFLKYLLLIKYGVILMEFLKQPISWFKSNFPGNQKKSKYILYKIVGMVEQHVFTLQCSYSKSTFQANISEIIHKEELLHSLHPLQACFIGIEYAMHIKHIVINGNEVIRSSNCDYPYGKYFIKQQDRDGNIYFFNKYTNEDIIMKPIDIVFSEKIISNFHAEQAFHIGFQAGLYLYKNQKKVTYLKNYTPSSSNLK